MSRSYTPWKSEWKAAGLDPGPLTPEEEALVPELQRENEQFLAAHPRRVTPSLSYRWANWAVPLAAAAALFLLPLVVRTGPTDSENRIKGTSTPQLVVYRQSASQPERLEGNAVVSPGDVLQAAYSVNQVEQGALVSIDGNGVVTVHLSEGNRSVELRAGGEHALPSSYQLDNAPSYEVFVLLLSSRPFLLDPIVKTMKVVPWRQWHGEQFGPGITFVELPLRKGPRS